MFLYSIKHATIASITADGALNLTAFLFGHLRFVW